MPSKVKGFWASVLHTAHARASVAERSVCPGAYAAVLTATQQLWYARALAQDSFESRGVVEKTGGGCMNALTRWLLIGAAIVICVPAHPGAQAAASEYRLKAAFVYRFPQFVEWPAAAIQDARTLDLCVLQPNAFGSDLQDLVSGESLAGRSLRVRVIAGVDTLPGCHLVFIGARSEAAAAVLKAVASRPVLTVGETDRFLEDGGIILLKIVERRVRFEVNATNAEKAGLRISAQLLGLAAAVRREPQ